MKKLPIVLAAWLAAFGADAQRHDQLLNDNWQFRFGHQVEKSTVARVDLPHTWNAQDALSGRTDYKRGLGHYERRLFVPADWKGQFSSTAATRDSTGADTAPLCLKSPTSSTTARPTPYVSA